MDGSGRVRVKAALVGPGLHMAEHVEIAWEGGTFTTINEARPSGDEIDVLALPAFINAHVHSGDGFMKDAGFHLSLESLVAPPDGLKHVMLASTPASRVIEGMRHAAREMARAGTRAFVDFREGGIDGAGLLLEAARSFPATGMARVLARPGEDAGDIDAIGAMARENDAITGFNLSTPGGVDDARLEAIARACKTGVQGRTLAFGTHAGETSRNLASCKARHGENDVERTIQYFGALERKCILVHCNHVDPASIQAIGDACATVVFCPGTAMLFGNVAGESPYRALMETGATCVLGTDNVMINAPDMFQAMNAFTRLLKMKHQGWVFDPARILEMATINPARMLGIDNVAGSIDAGKEASFLLLDTAHPAFHGTTDPVLAVLLRSHPGLLRDAWLQGKRVAGGTAP